MSILRRLLGETAIYGLSTMVASLVGFLLIPIYTRTFSPAEYGVLAQINTATTLATIFAVFGMDNSSAVWFWEHPEPDERARTFSTWFAFSMFAGTSLGLLAVLLRGPLSRTLLHDEKLSYLWLVFAANVALLNSPRVGTIWFRMHRRPIYAVTITILSSLASALFGVLLVAYMKFGIAGAVGAQLAGSTIGFFATMIALRKVLSISAIDLRRLGPMLRFSAPLVLMSKVGWLVGSALSFVVNLMCSASDAGLYQVGNSLASFIGIAIFAFCQAWSPFALSIRDESVARRVYGLALEGAVAIGILLAYGIAVFSLPILRMVAGPQYLGARWVLSFLALNMVLTSMPSVLSVTFARVKRTRPLASATIQGALVTLIGVFLMTRRWGKEGVAISVVLGGAATLIQAFRASQRVFPITVDLRRVGIVAGAATIWSALFFFVDQSSTLLRSIGVGAALFVSLGMVVAVVYRSSIRSALVEIRTI